MVEGWGGGFSRLRPMNEIQTAEFAIRCSVAIVILLLGAACCEIYRALLKAREEVERLRKLNSKNHHHRKTMERLLDTCCHYINTDIGVTPRLLNEMVEARNSSKEDND